MAYVSNESDRPEIYVRPFDASSGAVSADGKRQVTWDGASTVVSWRGDGRELYFNRGDLTDVLLMAVDASAASVEPATPRFLLRNSNPGVSKNISRDGQRFVFVTQVEPTPAP